MVKRIERVTWQCQVCNREWSDVETAEYCESFPGPKLKVGDMVLWRGSRDEIYEGVQTCVLDHIIEVKKTNRASGSPGHQFTYRFSKQYGVDSEIPGARSGYLNVLSSLNYPALHTQDLGHALRDLEKSGQNDDSAGVVALLRRCGLPAQDRFNLLYSRFAKLIYTLTWTEALPVDLPKSAVSVRYFTQAEAQAAAWVCREPTRENCLAFIGRGQWTGSRFKTYTYLDGAFDFNEYHKWGAMVQYDIGRAVHILMFYTDDELVDLVRQYRRDVLAGEAPHAFGQNLYLFRPDEAKSTGKWPADVLAFVRDRSIKGSGKTRLNRVHEAVFNPPKDQQERVKIIMKSHLKLWSDRQVIAVLSSKGGVGKSTVAADLARVATARGKKVLLFDADVYGPSQHLIFPTTAKQYKVKDKKIVPHLIEGIEVVSVGYLLDVDEPVTWRGPWLVPFLHMLGDNLATEADLVIVDMPPGTGDTYRALVEYVSQLQFLIVSTAGEIAMADVRRLIGTMHHDVRRRVIGIIENMAYMQINGSGPVPIWGSPDDVPQMADEFHLRLLGKLPLTKQGDERRQSLGQFIDQILCSVVAQIVPLDVISTVADRLIEKAKEDNLIFSSINVVHSLPNLANHLTASIVELGGDPLNLRYRETLLTELKRIHRAIGNQVPENADESEWWYPVWRDVTEA